VLAVPVEANMWIDVWASLKTVFGVHALQNLSRLVMVHRDCSTPRAMLMSTDLCRRLLRAVPPTVWDRCALQL
jgi:hypothetical protein